MSGMSRKEIAAAENVSDSSVNESIDRGLRALKKYLRNNENCPVKCP
jgi:DNA-directed RNA polymerase specialized sigma24 family protein